MLFKDQYAEKFAEQKQREAHRYLFVRNFNRKLQEIPVEGLIKQWKWYESILECLTLRVEELHQYPCNYKIYYLFIAARRSIFVGLDLFYFIGYTFS